MKRFIGLILLICSLQVSAQYKEAWLQASGLTCAMCSNAINKAVSKLSFVEKVDADLNQSAFVIRFKPGMPVNFDELRKKVEEAGFSVALLKVTANVNELRLKKGEVLVWGGLNLWVVNSPGGALSGEQTFQLLEKGFLTAKAYKKSGKEVTAPAYQSAIAAGKRVYVVTF